MFYLLQFVSGSQANLLILVLSLLVQSLQLALVAWFSKMIVECGVVAHCATLVVAFAPSAGVCAAGPATPDHSHCCMSHFRQFGVWFSTATC
jgi:hypothetical protein